MWCKRSFEREFSPRECRLFSTQKMMFEFLDEKTPVTTLWLPFTIELMSEENSSTSLSRVAVQDDSGSPLFLPVIKRLPGETHRLAAEPHGSPGPCPGPLTSGTNAFTAGKRPKREDFSLLYGTDPLSQQTRYFLACTISGLQSILDTIPPNHLHLYEIIREGRPCHLYFDVECEGNVDVHQPCMCITDDAEEEDCETNTLLVLPQEKDPRDTPKFLREQRTFTVDEYHQLTKLMNPLCKAPPQSCLLTCPCRFPEHTSTIDTLLHELYNFILKKHPHLFDKVPPLAEKHKEIPAHYHCWKRVLVMRSRKAVPKSSSPRKVNPKEPSEKFSQHYVIQLHGRVWESNLSVGVFVKEFVDFLYEKVACVNLGTFASACDEGENCDGPSVSTKQLHAALFFHSRIKMWSTLNNFTELPSSYRGGSAIPFFQCKCIIDTAVYTKNRSMRCLWSSKMAKPQAAFFIELDWMDGQKRLLDSSLEEPRSIRIQCEPAQSAFSKREKMQCGHSLEELENQNEINLIRRTGIFLNSLITLRSIETLFNSKSEHQSLIFLRKSEDFLYRPPSTASCSNTSSSSVVGSNSSSPPPEVIRRIEEKYSALSGKACKLSFTPRQMGRYFLYTINGTRYCQNVKREHKSNSVYVVLDLEQRWWAQKCFDPDCSHFRGNQNPID